VITLKSHINIKCARHTSTCSSIRQQKTKIVDSNYIYGTFAPGSENEVVLSFPRAKKSWNFRSQSETLGYNLVIYVRRFEITIYYTHVFRVRPR